MDSAEERLHGPAVRRDVDGEARAGPFPHDGQRVLQPFRHVVFALDVVRLGTTVETQQGGEDGCVNV